MVILIINTSQGIKLHILVGEGEMACLLYRGLKLTEVILYNINVYVLCVIKEILQVPGIRLRDLVM